MARSASDQWACLRQLFDLSIAPFGDVMAGSWASRRAMRGVSASTTTWGRGTVRLAARVLGGPMMIRPSTSGAVHVQAAGGQVDITDAEADEFGPAQASVRQDGDDIALVFARCG